MKLSRMSEKRECRFRIRAKSFSRFSQLCPHVDRLSAYVFHVEPTAGQIGQGLADSLLNRGRIHLREGFLELFHQRGIESLLAQLAHGILDSPFGRQTRAVA